MVTAISTAFADDVLQALISMIGLQETTIHQDFRSCASIAMPQRVFTRHALTRCRGFNKLKLYQTLHLLSCLINHVACKGRAPRGVGRIEGLNLLTMNRNQIGNEIYAKHTIERDGIFYSGERRKEILEMEWWQRIYAVKTVSKSATSSSASG
jgi:hypothetical protein